MLKEINANVWDIVDENSALCILTNNSVYVSNDNNYNPMGGGIAYEACIRNMGLEYIVGDAIINKEIFLCKDYISGCDLLRFSTMHKVGVKADIKLISESLAELLTYLKSYPYKKVYLPRPGCGIGGLDWLIDVKPIIENFINKNDINNLFIVHKTV